MEQVSRRISATEHPAKSQAHPWEPSKEGSGHVRFDISIDDPWEWISLAENLPEALEEVPFTWTTTVVVPWIDGHAVPTLALRWSGSSLWPAPEAVNDYWPDMLPQAALLPLNTAVQSAFGSLQCISMITYLRSTRNDPDLFAERFAREQDHLTTAIADASQHHGTVPEAIVSYLAEQTDNVQREGTGSVKPGTFAEAMTVGIMNQQDGLFQAIVGCGLLAAHWDINPAAAATLLDNPRLIGVGRMLWALDDDTHREIELAPDMLPTTASQVAQITRDKGQLWEARSMLGIILVGVDDLAPLVADFRQGKPAAEPISVDPSESAEFAQEAWQHFTGLFEDDPNSVEQQQRAGGPDGFRGDADRLASVAFSRVGLIAQVLAWFAQIRAVATPDQKLLAYLAALDRWAQEPAEQLLQWVDNLPEQWQHELKRTEGDHSAPLEMSATVEISVDNGSGRAVLSTLEALYRGVESEGDREDHLSGFVRPSAPRLSVMSLTISQGPQRHDR